MSMMRKLLEAMTKFAGEPEQKPGEQWKGTDKGTPGKKLVGDSIIKDLAKGPTPKTKEEELAEAYANFMEDDIGVEPKRPGRKSDRPAREYTKHGKPSKRYTTVEEGWNTGEDRVHLPDEPSLYWSGKGPLQNEYDALYEKLVPSQGKADTIEGEVLRAASKIVYRHYNDGDEFNAASYRQLEKYIGKVTSYDDLAHKSTEFAVKANGQYHPNADWDCLAVMDYGPVDDYDDEDEDEDEYGWEEDDDELEESSNVVARYADDRARGTGFVYNVDATGQITSSGNFRHNKKYSTPEKAMAYLEKCGFTKKGELEEADMFKAGQRAIKNIKSATQQRKSEAEKMAQAQAQIDADRENERDRFSQEELYPSDDSHDVDEGMEEFAKSQAKQRAAKRKSIPWPKEVPTDAEQERNRTRDEEENDPHPYTQVNEYDDEDEYEDEDQGFFVAIGSEDDGGFVGMVTKDGGKWREGRVSGKAPYNWGGSYMGYLTPDDVMTWIRKDYRNYDVEGPFDSEEEAREYAQNQYSLDEAKWFKTSYGWAGGRNEKTGGTYKHPDQIKADREAKKAQKQQKPVDEARTTWNNDFYVYDPKTKTVKKKFRTHKGAKQYAEANGLAVASAEYYHDTVNKEVEEGWEADLARSNRERMKKERAAAKPMKPIAKAKPNYDRVFQDINSAIGDTFPDGDPMDALMRKYRDSYGDLNIDLLNKACRVNGAKSYHDYVAKVWQQHMQDNPDLVQGGNPWVAEGEVSTRKYEMMLRNGQVKKFVAKDDADAKRIAAGHNAKSVIRMKGNVPGNKIAENDHPQHYVDRYNKDLERKIDKEFDPDYDRKMSDQEFQAKLKQRGKERDQSRINLDEEEIPDQSGIYITGQQGEYIDGPFDDLRSVRHEWDLHPEYYKKAHKEELTHEEAWERFGIVEGLGNLKEAVSTKSNSYKLGWNHGTQDEFDDEHHNDDEYAKGFNDGSDHASSGKKGWGKSNPKTYKLKEEELKEGALKNIGDLVKQSHDKIRASIQSKVGMTQDQINDAGAKKIKAKWKNIGDEIIKSRLGEALQGVAEGWESGPEERTTRERDPDAEYDARRQEKLDAPYAQKEPEAKGYHVVSLDTRQPVTDKVFPTKGHAMAYIQSNHSKNLAYRAINEGIESGDPVESAVLAAVQELIQQGHTEVAPEVITNMVVAATSQPFLLKDLVDCNNNSPAIQHYVDSINPTKVKFSNEILTVKNEDPMKDKKQAQAGVSSMAARAAGRNRLGESGDTPLRDPEDYQAKRSALQQIQMDPDTHKDLQLKAELARRLGSLNQQYSDLQNKLREFKESRGHKVIATKLGNIDRMNTVQIPTPAERQEQIRLRKEKEAGKKPVKEFAAPGANPATPVSAAKPAVDPAAVAKAAAATNTLKAATGTTVAPATLDKALDSATQGTATSTDVKALAPLMGVLNKAAEDPKLATQFKAIANQAKLTP